MASPKVCDVCVTVTGEVQDVPEWLHGFLVDTGDPKEHLCRRCEHTIADAVQSTIKQLSRVTVAQAV